jgi:hypothetical protein
MDVKANINELGSHVSSIALHIRALRLANKPTIITINGFEFECDLNSGEVIRKMTTNPESRVSEILGKGVSEPYADLIRRAHSLAAKIDLIERIQLLNDPALSKTIGKHPIDVGSADKFSEQSVHKALIMILGEIKTPFIAKFNLKFTEKSDKQKALYAALKEFGVDAIRTYGDVDAIWKKIPLQFKPDQQHAASKASKL